MAPLYSSGYRNVSAMRIPWPWTDSQSRESRRVIPAGKNEAGLGTAPGSASTKNRVLFALGSRRRNCRSGSRPIQRSRGPHLDAPPCQPASAGHRPRRVATQRRPRAGRRRKPGQWCLSTIASQRRRSVGLASRIPHRRAAGHRAPPGRRGGHPYMSAFVCPCPVVADSAWNRQRKIAPTAKKSRITGKIVCQAKSTEISVGCPWVKGSPPPVDDW